MEIIYNSKVESVPGCFLCIFGIEAECAIFFVSFGHGRFNIFGIQMQAQCHYFNRRMHKWKAFLLKLFSRKSEISFEVTIKYQKKKKRKKILKLGQIFNLVKFHSTYLYNSVKIDEIFKFKHKYERDET